MNNNRTNRPSDNRTAYRGSAQGSKGRPQARPAQGAPNYRQTPPNRGGQKAGYQRGPANRSGPGQQARPGGKRVQPGRAQMRPPVKKKPKITPEQKRQIREQKAFIRKQKATKLMARVIKWLIVFLKRAAASVGVAALILALYAVITLLRVVTGNNNHYTCSYVIGYTEKMYLSKTYADSVMIHDNIPYINLDDLVSYCGFTLTGNVDERKIVLHQDNDSYVKMTVKSNNIYINGIRYRLNGEIIRQLGSFWVPMDFVNKYLNGIGSEYDQENHILTIKRELTDENKARYEEYLRNKEDDNKENDIDKSTLKFDYKDITISISPQSATSKIDEGSLSEEIKYQTDPERLAREEEERRRLEELAQLTPAT